MSESIAILDDHLREQLAPFLSHLPEPVKIVVWGDAAGSVGEQEAMRLGQTLTNWFDNLAFEVRPRKADYGFYPVIGLMGQKDGAEVDYRVRLIGLPAGYQINSLVGAIQAVSFRASHLEGRTRIQLSRVPAGVDLQLFTAANDEAGPLVASLISSFAVANAQIQALTIMADVFTQAVLRYSIRQLPHLVINEQVHFEGTLNEDDLLQQIALALKNK